VRDVHVYIHADSETRALLTPILDGVRAVDRKVVTLMKTVKEFAVELDAETNIISAKLDALNAKIAAGTFTQEDADSLQGISDRLKVLGADASNPIPPVA
jgi:hypothetical protein